MQEDRTFHLIISSVTGALFDGQVASATIPGKTGEMTILPGHEPIVTTLKSGVVTARLPRGQSEDEYGDSRVFEIQDGVMECTGGRVTILL